MKLANVQGWLDRYATALRWITKGLGLLDGVEGLEASRVRADLLGWYGRFCQEAGHHNRAIDWFPLPQRDGVGDRVEHTIIGFALNMLQQQH